jgi:hypothetical protein
MPDVPQKVAGVPLPPVDGCAGGEHPKKRDHQSLHEEVVVDPSPLLLLLLLLLLLTTMPLFELLPAGQQRMLFGVPGHLPVR